MGIQARVAGGVKRGLRTVAAAYIDRTNDPTSARDNRDGAHTRLLLAFVLEADDNCIDIGAHSGDVLRDMLRFAPHGQHMAFEPIPALAAQLGQEFPQVDVRNAAVSDTAGEVSFTYVPEAPAYSGFRQRDYPVAVTPREITVRAEVLDDVLPAGYQPRLVKIDVEGAELQVLGGARRTLSAHKPIVIFEHGIGAADHYGTAPGDVYDLLDGLGYRVFDLDGKLYDRAEFERTFHSGGVWNYVAHP